MVLYISLAVIHLDVMYAANAGAISGHIGVVPCSGEAIANLSDIKKPVSVETGYFYIKAWQ